jgi:tetratricopeptide (TPR) repeat protein
MAKSGQAIKKLIKSGDSEFHKGDYDAAISHYGKAISLIRAPKGKDDLLNLIDAYNGTGHALRSKGKFTRARPFNEKALAMCTKLAKKTKGLDKRMALTLHYTADVLADLNQVDRALELSKTELKIAKGLYSKDRKNLFYLVYGLNVTANRLADKKKFKAAISLLNESLRAQNKDVKAKSEKGYPNLSWTYHALGTVLLSSGDTDSAIENLKKALEMRLVIADKNKRYIGALRNTLESLSTAYGKKNNTSARSARGRL